MRKPLLLLWLVTCVFLFAGCYHAKEFVYFQNLHAGTDTTKSTESDSELNSMNSIIIEPYDQLDIIIKTSAKALETLTESSSSGSALTGGERMTAPSSYLTGFQVGPNGSVSLPLLGNVNLKGLTILQAKNKIKDLMKIYMKDPYVDIKFLTFRISVLGQVTRPGIVIVPNEKADLIDVIAESSDLNDFGDRTNIKVIRGDPRNPKVYEIDLTNSKTFNSPGFILQPNDIVYVSPLPRKYLLLNLSEALPFLTAFNTLNIIVLVLVNLKRL